QIIDENAAQDEVIEPMISRVLEKRHLLTPTATSLMSMQGQKRFHSPVYKLRRADSSSMLQEHEEDDMQLSDSEDFMNDEEVEEVSEISLIESPGNVHISQFPKGSVKV